MKLGIHSFQTVLCRSCQSLSLKGALDKKKGVLKPILRVEQKEMV